MKKFIITSFLALMLLLSACTQTNNQELTDTINQQQDKIDSLQQQINSLTTNYGDQKKKIESLESQLADAEIKILELELNEDDGYAYLSPYSQGYSIATTDIGSLILSIEGIEPYLNGYNITLSVGNPHDITFNGLDFNVNCSANYYFADNNECMISISDKIHSGSWNTVSLSIPNIDENSFETIRIGVSSNSVSLAQ